MDKLVTEVNHWTFGCENYNEPINQVNSFGFAWNPRDDMLTVSYSASDANGMLYSRIKTEKIELQKKETFHSEKSFGNLSPGQFKELSIACDIYIERKNSVLQKNSYSSIENRSLNKMDEEFLETPHSIKFESKKEFLNFFYDFSLQVSSNKTLIFKLQLINLLLGFPEVNLLKMIETNNSHFNTFSL